MTEIIDFNKARAERDEPDDECIRRDHFGRTLYCFICEYEADGDTYAIDLWTYSFEDAQKAVAAIKSSLTVIGKKMSVLPW